MYPPKVPTVKELMNPFWLLLLFLVGLLCMSIFFYISFSLRIINPDKSSVRLSNPVYFVQGGPLNKTLWWVRENTKALGKGDTIRELWNGLQVGSNYFVPGLIHSRLSSFVCSCS